MKKLLIVLCAVLCIISLASCAKKDDDVPTGGTDDKQDVPAELNTIGDAYRENIGFEITEEYIKVITEEYICEAKMTSEINDALNAIDFMADDRDEKYAEILDALPIEKKTLRSDSKLSPEEIAGLIGKKGQEMLDMGYDCYGYYMNKDENSQFYMENVGYNYTVTVEEKYEDGDDIVSRDLFAQSTIKEIVES